MNREELVNKFKPLVHGYVGSSMLTNTEYPEQIEKSANECADICEEYAQNKVTDYKKEHFILVTENKEKFIYVDDLRKLVNSYLNNAISISKLAEVLNIKEKEYANSKWVSVDKELPNKDGKYICCGDYGITIQVWNISCNCWDDEDGDDYYSNAVDGKVDYWQQLPKVPNE